MRRARSPRRSNCGAVNMRVPGWRSTSATSNAATSSNRSTPRAENEQVVLFPRNPPLPYFVLLENFPDCDFEVREGFRRHDIGRGELVSACIPLGAGLTIEVMAECLVPIGA